MSSTSSSEIPPAYNPEPGTLPQFGPPFVRFVDQRFHGLDARLQRLLDELRPRDQWWRQVGSVELDASGNGTVLTFTVPANCEIFLHRLYVTVGTGTFASPVKTGSVEVRVDGQVEDGAAAAVNGFPQVFTSSSSAAIVYGPGETIQVAIVASTASVGATAVARGRLIRTHVASDEP